jgi:tetratricopeptide (TPR) repeat protein
MLNNQQKKWLEQVVSVYLQYQQYNKAQPLLILLLRFYPHEVRAVKQLAYLYYQQDNFDAALKYCKQYHEASGDDSDKATIYLLQSYCYAKLGQSTMAATCYKQFTEQRALS